MRKKLNLLFGLVLIISMIALIGCGGSGKTGEKNPYEGKWVAVSAQMMGMSVNINFCIPPGFTVRFRLPIISPRFICGIPDTSRLI